MASVDVLAAAAYRLCILGVFVVGLSVVILIVQSLSKHFELAGIYTIALLPGLIAAAATFWFRRSCQRLVRSRSGDGRVAVITGGCGGLGSCLADLLCQRGYVVAVLDIQSRSSRKKTGIKHYCCDVGDEAALNSCWEQIVRQYGAPDILVNNAAMVNMASVQTLKREDLEQVFRVNTFAPFTLSRLFVEMQRTKSPPQGTIVNVSSVLGQLGAAGLSAYCASKAALLAFHHTLEAELAHETSINCILVAPGQLDTPLFRQMKLHGWLRKFLGPVVSVERLAQQIVEAIDAQKGVEIWEPLFARWHGVLWLLPRYLRRSIVQWAGLHQAGFRVTDQESG